MLKKKNKVKKEWLINTKKNKKSIRNVACESIVFDALRVACWEQIVSPVTNFEAAGACKVRGYHWLIAAEKTLHMHHNVSICRVIVSVDGLFVSTYVCVRMCSCARVCGLCERVHVYAYVSWVCMCACVHVCAYVCICVLECVTFVAAIASSLYMGTQTFDRPQYSAEVHAPKTPCWQATPGSVAQTLPLQ